MRLLYVFALSVLSLLIHARTTDENLQVARYLVERLAMSPESIDNLDLLARRDYLKQHRESQFVLYEKNLLEVVCCSDEGVVVIVRDSLNGKSRGKGEVKSIVEKVLRAIVPRSKDVGMGGDGQVDSSDGGGYRG